MSSQLQVHSLLNQKRMSRLAVDVARTNKPACCLIDNIDIQTGGVIKFCGFDFGFGSAYSPPVLTVSEEDLWEKDGLLHVLNELLKDNPHITPTADANIFVSKELYGYLEIYGISEYNGIPIKSY